MSPIALVHIGAGLVAILSGSAALAFRKGFRWHRQAGIVFVLSMVVMAGIGAYRALFIPQALSVLQGIFAIYLVATAWLTIRRKEGVMGKVDYVAFLVVLSASTGYITFGIEALNSESGEKDGFLAEAYLIFGSVAVLATALDLRMIVRKGIYGVARIARHLWRMCYALFTAVGSFFLGQPQVFPESIRGIEYRAVPVVLVVLLMIFWLIRVLFTNLYKKPQQKRVHPTP